MDQAVLQIHPDGLTLGGKPFYLASGDMHYFRFLKSGWRRRLQLMKDFGLTAVQTYVPWDLHEPEKGQFCFSDNLDIGAFLAMCQDIGLKVLLRLHANFHEAYGFSWVVTDIDPSYTMGDMARRRQEILQKLKEEGVIDMNKTLPVSPFAQRIAVISSAQAAGYGDFCHQIDDNSYGLSFSHELFAAIMQGEQVEQSVIAALDRINARIDEFDVVVIIRGGGATTDMSGFDTLALAENVANFPLPIITGIGHDRD